MKKQIFAYALSGLLLLTGIAIAFSGKVNHAVRSTSIDDVLRAHKVPQTLNALAAYSGEAKKLMYYHVEPGSELPGFFERKVTVSTDGSAFRRDKIDPLGFREQIDIVGKQAAYRSIIENGKQVGPPSQLGDSESKAVKSAVNMFGLIPFLKQLQDASVEAVYLGRAEYNLEKFSIKTASDNWTMYVDSRHLIRRIQMVRNHHKLTIDYSDYRAVEGVQLAFIQRLSADETLVYELFFTSINLNPSFAGDHFIHDARAKESMQ